MTNTLIDGITVIERMRALGRDLSPRNTWAAGQLVMRRYVALYREQPPKDNRAKTNTVGVHCFAIYPPSFRDEIDAIVLEMATRQPDLLDLLADA